MGCDYATISIMVITYFGGQFVRIQQGDTVIAFNPFGKDSKRKNIRFGANLALVSMNHPDMNGIENMAIGEKRPFVVSGPGEYEVGGIHIAGFPSGKRPGGEERINTIYTVHLEGVRICFLGAHPSAELSSETIEGIGECDICFVPVSGADALSPADAEKLSVTLDAKLVIPVGVEGKEDKNLRTFLKESGAENAPVEEKITLKKKDLDGKEGEVRVLLPQTSAS